MTKLQALACPTCGAPLPTSARDEALVCPYCKASIAPAPKQSTSAVTTTGGPQSFPCPRCGDALFVGQAGTFRLLGCGRCGGVWLRRDSEREILARVVKAAIYLADKAAENAVEQVPLSGAPCCPVCRLPLVRHMNDSANVELDRCEEHGTWFDRGELQEVSGAMEAFRNNWRDQLRAEEMRQIDQAIAEQEAIAEEGAAKRLFRALGALLSGPTDHGGFEDAR